MPLAALDGSRGRRGGNLAAAGLQHPRRLHAIARESVARYGGELPSDADTLLSFKGIGEYTRERC